MNPPFKFRNLPLITAPTSLSDSVSISLYKIVQLDLRSLNGGKAIPTDSNVMFPICLEHFSNGPPVISFKIKLQSIYSGLLIDLIMLVYFVPIARYYLIYRNLIVSQNVRTASHHSSSPFTPIERSRNQQGYSWFESDSCFQD